MIVFIDIQTVSVVVAAIGVLIAAVNQIYTSRQANQQRAIDLKNQELALRAQEQELETWQAQLFTDINQPFNTTEIRRSL